ncbi:D-aminoacylase (plasmid) [Geminicoccaceae bacterium 1502E]|nr:D-aminoacylase [Geminicoccaceae bacterium 1502E]
MRKSCSLVIRNVSIIDGTGAPARQGDIAVDGDRIVALGDINGFYGQTDLDGDGLALAPGFVDVHTHDDRALLSNPDMAAKVSQGVTTVITGNCGISLAPFPREKGVVPPMDLIAQNPEQLFPRFSDYFEALAARPPAINAAALVGHSTLRMAVMDRLDRAATGEEIKAMRSMVERSLEDGAIGMSTGLYYAPAAAASTAEVEGVGEPLGRYGRVYTTHMRDEAEHVMEALEEAFQIGRSCDCRVIISHHKVTNPKNHGRTRETLPLIEKRSREQPVGLDVYPYCASSTILEERRVGLVDRILVTWSKARPDLAGRDLSEIASELGVSREEAARRLAPAGAVYFTMSEDDVQRVLKFPQSMIGSDGLPHDERPHPRLWGTFPRVLGHYSRDLGLFGIEDAVRRMTSLPAEQFSLRDRGVLREGMMADLVLFDPATVIDSATFDEPIRPAEGVRKVIVNGRMVWDDGKPTGQRPGRVLRPAG